jgi:hypothetical protein
VCASSIPWSAWNNVSVDSILNWENSPKFLLSPQHHAPLLRDKGLLKVPGQTRGRPVSLHSVDMIEVSPQRENGAREKRNDNKGLDEEGIE